MKQAVRIPDDLIDQLMENNDNPQFYVWLMRAGPKNFIMPRPEGMSDETYDKRRSVVSKAVTSNPKGFSLVEDGFIINPDFEIDTRLEHVIELLEYLRRRRERSSDILKMYFVQWIGVVVKPYLKELGAYLEPYSTQGRAGMNKSICLEEARRFTIAELVAGYKKILSE